MAKYMTGNLHFGSPTLSLRANVEAGISAFLNKFPEMTPQKIMLSEPHKMNADDLGDLLQKFEIVFTKSVLGFHVWVGAPKAGASRPVKLSSSTRAALDPAKTGEKLAEVIASLQKGFIKSADTTPMQAMIRAAGYPVPVGHALPSPQIAGLLPAVSEATLAERRQEEARRARHAARIFQRLLKEEQALKAEEWIFLPGPVASKKEIKPQDLQSKDEVLQQIAAPKPAPVKAVEVSEWYNGDEISDARHAIKAFEKQFGIKPSRINLPLEPGKFGTRDNILGIHVAHLSTVHKGKMQLLGTLKREAGATPTGQSPAEIMRTLAATKRAPAQHNNAMPLPNNIDPLSPRAALLRKGRGL